MIFFRLIIPTYGKEPLLDEAVSSVLHQTITNEIEIIVVHDNFSHPDGNDAIKQRIDGVTHLYSRQQRWNGGARNVGMEYSQTIPYTLFLDHDDRIPDRTVLEELKNFILKNGSPDIIRLPYTKYYVDKDCRTTKMMREEKTMLDLINSTKVAPWTKCIKTDLIPDFPENTVFEDVCHHLKSCDICNSYARFDKPIVEWRIWDGQTSKKKGSKWESSKWRFIADLMDLELKKKDVRARRDAKLKAAINGLFEERGMR